MITISEIEFESKDQRQIFNRIKEIIDLSNRIKYEEWQLDEKEIVFGSIKKNGFVIKPLHAMGFGSGFSTINAHGSLGNSNSIVVKFKLSIVGMLSFLIMFLIIYQFAIHFDEFDLSNGLITFGIFGLLIIMTIRRTSRDLKKTEKLLTRIVEQTSKQPPLSDSPE